MADLNISPAAAYSGAFDQFLIDRQKATHDALMDQIAQQREARAEENEKLDQEIRREELRQSKEGFAQKIHDKKVDTLHEYLKDQGPGDIPSPEMKKLGDELGMPLRLGAAPTIPAGSSQVSMPQSGIPSEVGGPAKPTVSMPGAQPAQQIGEQPYLGTRMDVARGKLADVIAKGADRQTVMATALRLGIDPREAGQVETGLTGPKPVGASSYIVQDKDGKQLPGMVSMQNGVPLLNGEPIPEGATVVRAAGAVDNSPLKPDELRLAQDVATGKLTYDQALKSYGFQRQGRERFRMIYDEARKMNPSLSPVTLATELHAYQNAFTKVQGMKSAVDAYAGAANKNYQLLTPILDKIPDTGFSGTPNQWVREANKFLGSKEQAQFDLLMKSLQSEYTRLIENPNLTGMVTQQSREDLKDVAGTSLTKDQLRGVFEMFQKESGNRSQALADEIEVLKSNIGNAAGAPPAAGGGTTATPDELWKRFYDSRRQ